MRRQKFHKGDRVRVSDAHGLFPEMTHNQMATVLYTYETDCAGYDEDEYDYDGDEDEDDACDPTYGLDFDSHGEHAWFDEDSLTLVTKETSHDS